MEKIQVCDMGLAKVKRLTESTVTCINKGPGTFPYMAPEMFKERRRGPAADIYSLGCLLNCTVEREYGQDWMGQG